MRLLAGIEQIAVGKILRPQPIENTAVRADRDAQSIDTVVELFPTVGDRHQLVGVIVAVRVDHQHHVSFAGDKHALSTRIVRRRQGNTDRRNDTRLVPKQRNAVLQTISVTIVEQVNAAIVGRRDQLAIRAAAHVVDIRQINR